MVRRLVQQFNVSLMCFQESKVSEVSKEFVTECCGPAFTGFCFQPAVGTRGGIIMAWKDNEITVSSSHCTPSFISAACCHPRSGKAWRVIGVYGPQADADKISFLGDLRATMTGNPGRAFCASDFNLIYQLADKSNNRVNRRMMNAFRHFISDMELKDLYLHGRSFTWSNE